MIRYGFLAGMMIVLAASALAGEVVVLTEAPVAEFTLPDGSVLKNAFVWRRNSEGLMIVHDDGHYFLNYNLLSGDWKTAYLGESTEEESAEPEPVAAPAVDRYKTGSILDHVPALSEEGIEWLLRADVGEEAQQMNLSLAVFQCLLSNNREKAKRYFLIIEEKGFRVDAVKLDRIFNPCAPCSGEGEYEQDCPTCKGSGDCVTCAGKGLNKYGVGKSNADCKVCEGSGECVECDGEKTAELPCETCGGRGQLLDRAYCQVNRDHIVRSVNEAVGVAVALTQDEIAGVKKIFVTFPRLEPDARDFYLSDDYDGGMNTEILAACVMQSLLKDKLAGADRFNLMLAANFPKSKVLKIKDYIQVCEACKTTGRAEQACPDCTDAKGKDKGKKKGQCSECEGIGKAKKELGAKIDCETCDGSGECVSCKGTALVTVRCGACKGRGRKFESLRAEIKLEILVDDLNDFYKAYLKEQESPDLAD